MKRYLKVKYEPCDCGHTKQIVVCGFATLSGKTFNEEVIGYDCNCKQIPIDLEAVKNTPRIIPSY